MAGGIFQIIKKAFRRTKEPASTIQSPEKSIAPLSVSSGDAPSREDDGSAATHYSPLSYEESPTLEAIVAPPDVLEFAKLPAQNAFAIPEGYFDPSVRLVDVSLVNRVAAHRIDLSKIDIAMLGISVGTVNSLKRAHMTTLAQLANCSRSDLLRARSIGITKVDQIEKAMNSFLVGLLPRAEQKPSIQASHESNVEPMLVDQDVSQELSELAKNLSDIFQAKVPIGFIRLIPSVWNDLARALGEEPASFTDLEQLAQKTEGDLSHGMGASSMERYLASKRVTQWLKRATRYGCIDEEIEYVVSSLKERERTILVGRYRTDGPLTLEAIGQQLGITRERVRQIQVKVQRKLVTRIKRSTLLYSTAALYILKTQGEDASLAS